MRAATPWPLLAPPRPLPKKGISLGRGARGVCRGVVIPPSQATVPRRRLMATVVLPAITAVVRGERGTTW